VGFGSGAAERGKNGDRFRRPIVAVASGAVRTLALAAWMAACPILSATASVFEVKDVAVDVTGSTATGARESAHAEGERLAFRRLLERLTIRSDHVRLPDLSRSDIDGYVQDFSVADEKTSAVRYLAKLTFRFKPEQVRTLLDRLGIPFAETMSRPVLVLPVYQSAGALLLWDDPNPWRTAWSGQMSRDGLVPIVLPNGDLPDVAAIGAEQAAAGDEARLAAVARRYGTTDSAVAVATIMYLPQQPLPFARVFVSRHGPSAQKGRAEFEIQSVSVESIETLLRRAAVETARLIEDSWKRDNLLRLDQASVAAVSVPIGKLGDWLGVQKKLANVSVIRRADIVLMSRNEVRVNLQFIGDAEQLVLALGQADLQLIREGDIWILVPAKSDSG